MISTKKLATIGAAAALFATTAMPAFAYHRSGVNLDQSNSAFVMNNVDANSNTGDNTLRGSGRIRTGDAATVVDVTNLVNSNDATVNTCGCRGKVDVDQTNRAFVMNNVDANSNTGDNSVRGSRHHHDSEYSSFGGGYGSSSIKTGDAFTGASVTNLVNSNVAVVGSASVE